MASCHLVIVMGASGDLAKKSIYPALWKLFRDDLLPQNTFVIGFARSDLIVDDLVHRCKDYIQVEEEHRDKYDAFWKINHYCQGSYTDESQAGKLTELCASLEEKFDSSKRTFYLALPPFVYESVTSLIKENWMATKGRTKVTIEKPFGRDLETSIALDKHLSKLFKDEEIVRVDHYLALEMVQAILALRFGNSLFNDVWNNRSVASVMITFKEDFGTMGRGGYFDKNGIIRDVMQNHLLQVLSLIAMERPLSNSDQDVKVAKANLVRSILPVKKENIVLGQYVGNSNGKSEDERTGYREDKTVSDDSTTATFATIVFYISTERWDGVPFIMRCGKATNEVKDEVRIQFKSVPQSAIDLFPMDDKLERNELVIQLKPEEKIIARIVGKHPGLDMDLESTLLDLNYAEKYKDVKITGPYERIFLSIINDSNTANFVGREELFYSWQLFTPLLAQIDGEKPEEYVFGSFGPKSADELCTKHNFLFTPEHPW